MNIAQNTEHTSTMREFVKACESFRQEFGFSSGLVPEDDLDPFLHTFGSTGPLERVANFHVSSIYRLPIKARA